MNHDTETTSWISGFFTKAVSTIFMTLRRSTRPRGQSNRMEQLSHVVKFVLLWYHHLTEMKISSLVLFLLHQNIPRHFALLC
jgi:hypothetical protein